MLPGPRWHLPHRRRPPSSARPRSTSFASWSRSTRLTSTAAPRRPPKRLPERLRAAGIPDADIRILGPSPTKQNLVARLHGSGRRPPLLLLGHLDVVEAHRADWSIDPFHLTERDGYYYGRGTHDMKSLDAYWVAHVLRLRREKQASRPRRHPGADRRRRSGHDNGVEWLLAHAPELIRAALRTERGRQRRAQIRPPARQRRAGQRKGLLHVPPRSTQQGRPQLAAGT